MTEQEYYNALIALGCLDVTSNRQRSNGTTAFATPTGHVVSEHTSGYIRRNMYREKDDMGAKGYYGGGKCYQLNPTYDVNHESIGMDGKLRKTTRKERTRKKVRGIKRKLEKMRARESL